ncbi:MAG: DNA cytosine methyltransferase [Synechococcaceae cyanobacterium SM1_2_3]|nr:DNA cytosine methyltransferase [Synechococcaceae cyanobacterium SM1_2_3]
MQIPIAGLAPSNFDAKYAVPAPQPDRTDSIIDTQIRIIDLFAGCGGMGEGFATFRTPAGQAPFRMVASVENDPAACRTLRLRSFYHHALQSGDPTALDAYYAYVRGERDSPIAAGCLSTAMAWQAAQAEVVEQTLGEPETAGKLRRLIEQAQITPRTPLVLVGGPPCQAYSSAGRGRNAGIADYRPELDGRHFLYRVYLELLRDYKPVAFILENVKGMLSSRIAGRRLFPRILNDLSSPATVAGGKSSSRSCYRIYSLVNGASFRHGQDASLIRPDDFIVQAEHFGIPQSRHRVILFGLREDLADTLDRLESDLSRVSVLLGAGEQRFPLSTQQALADLPPLQSSLSWRKSACEKGEWADTLKPLFADVARAIQEPALRAAFEEAAGQVVTLNRPQWGRSVIPRDNAGFSTELPEELAAWYRGQDPTLVLNHETRAHMPEDLARYLFCAVYARQKGISPHASDFPDVLAPRHRSWTSGKFNDRFRVQLADQPATTVMSHLAKDGHYAIHYDPAQCRSLTVREAARLQTFPDSYFFEGTRTKQYIQVGNAVPPFLARQVAAVVWKLLRHLGYG